jgi:hypothetical protein
MSQYIWKTEKYEFKTGWDGPLEYYFLVVEHINQKKKKKTSLFSNLEFPTGPGMTLEEIEKTCQRYVSALPADIKTALQNDKIKQDLGLFL